MQSLEPQLVTEGRKVDETAHGEHKALECQVPVGEVLVAAEPLVCGVPLWNVQVNLGVVDAVGVRAERHHVEQLDPPVMHGGNGGEGGGVLQAVRQRNAAVIQDIERRQ